MSKGEIKKQKTASENVQKEIDAKMEEEKALSAEGKELYKKSLPIYFEGVMLNKNVVDSSMTCAENASNLIKDAPALKKPKLTKKFSPILYLAPKIGPDLKNLLSTGSKYITYAKKNNVKIPKDASEAMGDL
jgi:hypothetical protein